MFGGGDIFENNKYMDFLPNQGLIDSVKYHEAGGKKAIEKAYKHSNENQYTIGFGTSYLYTGLENGFKPFMRKGTNGVRYGDSLTSLKKEMGYSHLSNDKFAEQLVYNYFRGSGTYNSTRLGQELINDFHQILIINLNLNLDALKTEERKYIKRTNKVEFWDNLRVEINRNKFGRYRAKYIKIMHSKKIKHSENLGQKIEEKTAFLSDANSPKKTAINKGVFENSPIASDVIKGENAPLTQTLIIKHLQNIVSFSLDSINKNSHRFNTIKEEIKAYKNIKNIDEVINLRSIDKRICEVTGLDISMQKANSRYLCFSGLKYYQINAPEIFKDLERRYLTTKAKDKDLDARIYYMAHNIRNTKTNKKHNRKRFEARNYPLEQLSLF